MAQELGRPVVPVRSQFMVMVLSLRTKWPHFLQIYKLGDMQCMLYALNRTVSTACFSGLKVALNFLNVFLGTVIKVFSLFTNRQKFPELATLAHSMLETHGFGF